MGNRVSVIGIGAGSCAGMTLEAAQRIRESELLIGAARMLESAACIAGQARENESCIAGQAPLHMFASYRPTEIGTYLRAHPECENPCILVSGDVGFYSAAKRLIEELSDFDVELLPGISSVQYFAAKLQMPWEDWHLMSLHGKKQNLIAGIRRNSCTFALLGGPADLERICEKLCRYGMRDVTVHIGERLSYPGEQIRHVRADQTEGLVLDQLLVVLFENPDPIAMYGAEIPDEAFIRGKVPMTKSEVRTVSISKLHLTKGAVLYDIGAGTGSVSIQAACTCPDCEIWAVEKKAEAAELIRQNKDLFAADAVTVIEGTAPECMEKLPAPTHVFIGGSTGNMEQILDAVWEKNRSARIVINAIALETISQVLNILKRRKIEPEEILQVSTAKARTLAGYHMMTGQNPVTVIVVGEGEQEDGQEGEPEAGQEGEQDGKQAWR